jgi:TPR repeat protein
VNNRTYQFFCVESGVPLVVKRVLWLLVLTISLATTLPSAADDFASAKQAFEAKQFPKAIRLLRPLAQKGDPRAQHLLGYAYMFGMGVMTSEKRAQYWLSKAVAQNYTPAFARLGQVLLTIDESSTRGVELIKTAVGRGDLDAHLTLGMIYLIGLKGVPPDLEKSKHLFTVVAERKHKEAAFFLAYWYASDQGKMPDYIEVLRWAIIDSRIGKGLKAEFFRIEAMKRLTKEQIAEAKIRAAAWLKAHGETP